MITLSKPFHFCHIGPNLTVLFAAENFACGGSGFTGTGAPSIRFSSADPPSFRYQSTGKMLSERRGAGR
jgi:hypothetical protein